MWQCIFKQSILSVLLRLALLCIATSHAAADCSMNEGFMPIPSNLPADLLEKLKMGFSAQSQGAMLATTFLIQSPELSALNSTAQQDVLADMFDSVLGNATVQFSVAGAVPGAPESLSVRFNATLPQDEVSSISNGSCCDQYAAALQAALQDTSTPVKVVNPFGFSVSPVEGEGSLLVPGHIGMGTSNVTAIHIVGRLLGACIKPFTPELQTIVASSIHSICDQLQLEGDVTGYRDSSAEAKQPAEDVSIAIAGNWSDSPAMKENPTCFAIAIMQENLQAAGCNATVQLNGLGISTASDSLLSWMPAVPPGQQPWTPLAAPSTLEALVQGQMQITGAGIVPFTPAKQHMVLVAAASSGALLPAGGSYGDISVASFTEHPAAASAPSPGSLPPFGRRLLTYATAGGRRRMLSSAPWVEVTLQFLIFGAAVDLFQGLANPAPAPGPAAAAPAVVYANDSTLAMRIFEASMLQQGIRVTAMINSFHLVSPYAGVLRGVASVPLAGLSSEPLIQNSSLGNLTAKSAAPGATSDVIPILLGTLIPAGVLLVSFVALVGLLAWHRRRSRKRKEGQQPADEKDIHDSPASLGVEPSMRPLCNSDDLTTTFKRCIGAAAGPSASDLVHHVLTLTRAHETAVADTSMFLLSHLTPGKVFKAKYEAEGRRWRGTGTMFLTATQLRPCKRKVLLKFFASQPDLEREATLLHILSSIFPEVYEYSAPELVGHSQYNGDIVPAHMVTARPLCSLQDWLDRSNRAWEESDKFATLLFIVRALHAIHAAGMALCDLSPASFAWFAEEEDSPAGWRLISASQCTLRGSHMRIVTFLRYAAPEILAAESEDGRQEPVLVSPTLDMWALGCIAYRIFTGKHFLGCSYNDKDCRDMLKGEADLPFEGKGSTDFVAGSCLRGVPQRAHNMLRHLLRRKPILRMTIEDVMGTTFPLENQQALKAAGHMRRAEAQVTCGTDANSSEASDRMYSTTFCRAVATLDSQDSNFRSSSGGFSDMSMFGPLEAKDQGQ